jgi:ubiquinone/menaquinone biosynthesis C-methylase UbiE
MHRFAHYRRNRASQASGASTKGLILRGGWRYDLTAWVHDTLSLRGGLRQLRQRTVALAQVQAGEAVLDVGCGTGTLLLDMARQVDTTGRVVGVDPSQEQIARARAKAARRGLSIEFQIGVIEQLPFPDQTFDVVFSTLVMHHLPAPLKRQGIAEMARVLKPAGRLILADFMHQADRTGRAAHVHAGGSRMHELAALVSGAGFSQLETEEIHPPRFSAFPGASILRACKGDVSVRSARKAGETDV